MGWGGESEEGERDDWALDIGSGKVGRAKGICVKEEEEGQRRAGVR